MFTRECSWSQKLCKREGGRICKGRSWAVIQSQQRPPSTPGRAANAFQSCPRLGWGGWTFMPLIGCKMSQKGNMAFHEPAFFSSGNSWRGWQWRAVFQQPSQQLESKSFVSGEESRLSITASTTAMKTRKGVRHPKRSLNFWFVHLGGWWMLSSWWAVPRNHWLTCHSSPPHPSLPH